MSATFKNLSLDGTYVLQEVSSNIECNDPLTEKRDRDAEMVSELAAIYGPQSLNLGAANVRWRGESRQQRNNFVETRKQSNGVDCFDIAVNGNEALVFTQENGSGKLVRFWIDRDTNVSARIRYVNTPSNPVSWRLEVYVNRRNGKWIGTKIAEHHVHRTVTQESELTVAKYVALYFARFAPKAKTQAEKDEALLTSAFKSATVTF